MRKYPLPQPKNVAFANTASSSITRLQSTRMGYNAIDGYVNAVCTTQKFRVRMLVITRFQRSGRRYNVGWRTFLLRHKREASQERNRRNIAEITVLFSMQNNSLTVQRNLYLRLSLLYYFYYGTIRSYLVCSITIKE
jgi:hypothetical protein